MYKALAVLDFRNASDTHVRVPATVDIEELQAMQTHLRCTTFLFRYVEEKKKEIRRDVQSLASRPYCFACLHLCGMTPVSVLTSDDILVRRS